MEEIIVGDIWRHWNEIEIYEPEMKFVKIHCDEKEILGIKKKFNLPSDS